MWSSVDHILATSEFKSFHLKLSKLKIIQRKSRWSVPLRFENPRKIQISKILEYWIHNKILIFAIWFSKKFLRVDIPLISFLFLEFLENSMWPKNEKSIFRIHLWFLTLSKKFENSDFSDFLGIKSEISNMIGHPRFGWTPFISHALPMNLFYYVGKYCIKVWKVKVTAVNSLKCILKCNKTKLQFTKKIFWRKKWLFGTWAMAGRTYLKY